MKSSVKVDKDILRAAKMQAAREGITLSKLVEDAIAKFLKAKKG